MAQFKVISPCVVVKGAGYLYRGAPVPATADVDDVKRLAKEGMLAPVAKPAARKPAAKEVNDQEPDTEQADK